MSCFSVIGATPLSRQFEFKKPFVQLPEAVFKNPILSKLEWKNLNVPEQILLNQFERLIVQVIYKTNL